VNKTVTDKHGNVITLCNYRWVEPGGNVETCRHAKACDICGQCSRLVGEHESGHCCGHSGLHFSIKVPGMEADQTRAELERVRGNLPKRVAKKPKPQRKAPVVEHKPVLKKV